MTSLQAIGRGLNLLFSTMIRLWNLRRRLRMELNSYGLATATSSSPKTTSGCRESILTRGVTSSACSRQVAYIPISSKRILRLKSTPGKQRHRSADLRPFRGLAHFRERWIPRFRYRRQEQYVQRTWFSLIVSLTQTIVERKPVYYGPIISKINRIEATLREVNEAANSVLLPSLPAGIKTAEVIERGSGKPPLRVLCLGKIRFLPTL